MIRAVITIGSNSTRMLCASVLDGEVTVIGRGREETRLFLGLDEEGRLTPEAMTGCVRAVRSLTDEARDEGAQGPVRVYATSATRDAVNQAEFLALLRDAGCPARVLSGKEEASLAFRAAADGDDALVTDIGGGSTELVRGRDGSISRSVSLQLGASRLYRVSPIDSLSSLDRIRDVILKALAGAEDILSSDPPRMLYGIGGTLTSLAAVMLEQPFLKEDQDRIPVPFPFLRETLERISVMPEEERLRVTGIPPTRIRYIPHGLAILEQICLMGHFDHVTVRTKTNLDALIACPTEKEDHDEKDLDLGGSHPAVLRGGDRDTHRPEEQPAGGV